MAKKNRARVIGANLFSRSDDQQARRTAHHETIIDDKGPMPSDKSTGTVFAVVFLILAIVFRNDAAWAWTMIAISGVFAALTVFAASWLAPLNRAWFALALILNRVVSPVIMFVIYAIAIIPFGLALQLRADPLRRRKPTGSVSYWIDRAGADPTNMRDQF
ncbi:MAG: hypothetical protein AAFV45_13925 [Pseudomonadota bacterium]